MGEFKIGFSFLALCIIFSSVQSNPVYEEKKPFSIEEATLGQLAVNSYSGKWISDVEIEYLDKASKDVKVLNVEKNETSVALRASVLEKYKTTTYNFSPDRKFVLISYDEKPVFRHSKKARYVVYSVSNGDYYNITNEHLQIAEWSPLNSYIAFVKDNDLYVIKKIDSKMESYRLTTDGKPAEIFNGVADWVYEEEILGSNKAFWFSPDGSKIAFLTLFDTNVRKVLIPEYGEPGDLQNQYVNEVDVSYPKSGSKNPTYKLSLVDLEDEKKSIRNITEYNSGVEVFYGLDWYNSESLIYLQTNRVQNSSKFYLYISKSNGSNTVIYTENNAKGWANINFPNYNKKYGGMVRVEGIQVGDKGNYKHLVYHGEKGLTYPLTMGLFEVLKVIKWDEDRKIIYYSANEEGDSTTTQIYAIGEAKGSKAVCLTCQIKSPEGRNCKDASASFSKNSSYIILHCNGPDPKMVYLYKSAQPLGKPLAVLEDNTKLRNELKKKLLPDVMNLTVDVPGGFKADVRLQLPPNMDRSGKTKYPLLIYVYGGPASKNIYDTFKIDWSLYVTTNLSVIYGIIDGRNTLKKGENMLFAGYRALGTLEISDQISVTRYLQNTFNFVDPSRTGIWGWSYGGYATTKVLETDEQNVFKCGVAVAPVADWIYYDSMYTERYMGLPQENKIGYENANVLKNITNLQKKKYFLIHGNADDNVHYQNAMMIAKALERNNIPFRLMSYPDEDHSLKNVRKHLYYTMSDFWKSCFNLK